MTATFDQEKCQRRNRIAARRDGVNAAPIRFLRSAPTEAQDAGLRYAHGTLPATPEAALERINALLPPDAPALTLDQVYIHYVEAANGNFVPDRWMFLADNTLRNIAREAGTGVAFMNSHRTGGLSHQSELPFGKTFAGRYEEYQDGTKRALVAFYMLRGVKPNGDGGPSTDELHMQIEGGTIPDVSVGLFGGQQLCDVCGAEVDAEDPTTGQFFCKHAPGTDHKMTADEQAAQKERGVPKGYASYSMHDAHLGEVSAVFDGAIPGAGFRKTLALARRRQLTATDVMQARHAYATLLKQGDFGMDDIVDAIEQGFGRALRKFGRQEPANMEGTMELQEGLAPLVDPRYTELQQQLATEQAARATQEARLTQMEATQRQKDATVFADRLIEQERVLLPNKRPQAIALFARLLAVDATGDVVTFNDALGVAQQQTCTQLLSALFTDLPAHTLTGEAIPGALLTRLPANTGSAPTPTPEEKTARKTTLLKMTPLGRAAATNGNGKEH